MLEIHSLIKKCRVIFSLPTSFVNTVKYLYRSNVSFVIIMTFIYTFICMVTSHLHLIEWLAFSMDLYTTRYFRQLLNRGQSPHSAWRFSKKNFYLNTCRLYIMLFGEFFLGKLFFSTSVTFRKKITGSVKVSEITMYWSHWLQYKTDWTQ